MNLELGTVLSIWAHPDDETYLSAGIMASAVRAGSRVVCVTATRGELGSQDPVRWPVDKLGAIREAELLACLGILGVTEHIWLDYHDGSCDSVPHEEGLGKVRAILEQVQPDTVLTFGPEGMTDHPDHKAVSAWTTAAFHQAAKPGARLCYATMTPDWAERFVPELNRFNVFGPGTPPVTPRDALAIELALPLDVLALKMAGIKAHVSQVDGMMKAFGEQFVTESQAYEFYRLGAVRST